MDIEEVINYFVNMAHISHAIDVVLAESDYALSL